jgi:uncharacterized Ntn-hydrolase superfamily protein
LAEASQLRDGRAPFNRDIVLSERARRDALLIAHVRNIWPRSRCERIFQPDVATFSIVAVDLETGDLGVSVASKFLAVGAVVPWANAGAGAVATQSYANVAYGPDGIGLMREGLSAAQALERLISADDGRDQRQVGLVDARGGAAAYTGVSCHAWAGHQTGAGFACQGNLLTGPETTAAMAAAFAGSAGPLGDRLLAALEAGDIAGGDRRGRQSAALYVARHQGGYLGANDVFVDLRVDDAAHPVQELRRLLTLHNLYLGASAREDAITIDAPLLRELQEIMRRRGHYHGAVTGGWDEATESALMEFVGTENLEERVDLKARTIDAPALAFVRKTFGAG